MNRSLSSTLVRGSASAVLWLLIFSASVKAPAGQETARDDRVGVCVHFSQNWSVDQIMPLIAKSGVGWIRDDLHWRDLEPTLGDYQIPAKTRAWIQAARRMGLKIVLVLAYGNPAYGDQYDTAAYAKAAGWLARELANDVQAIEILNEPNNFGFRDMYGGAWNGKEPDGSVTPYLQKYVEILNAAAKEIKSANPNMTVIGLGTPAPASFRMIALGLAPQVDGLTDHPYGGKLPELVPYADTPSFIKRDGIPTADSDGTFASQVSMFRAQARKWNATEKLWDTEWGYPTVRAKAGKAGMSEETQAVYILRRLLESHAAGVEHTFVYEFKDEGTNPYSDGDNFGLVNNDRSAKQSYLVLQRITGILAGMETAPSARQASIDTGAQQQGLGYRCRTFVNPDEQRTIIAFWAAKPWDPNESATSAVVSLPLDRESPQVSLYNPLTGNRTEISGKLSEDVSDDAGPISQTNNSTRPKSDHRFSVTVSITAAPQLLMIR
jgi:hypothetical protein